MSNSNKSWKKNTETVWKIKEDKSISRNIVRALEQREAEAFKSTAEDMYNSIYDSTKMLVDASANRFLYSDGMLKNEYRGDYVEWDLDTASKITTIKSGINTLKSSLDKYSQYYDPKEIDSILGGLDVLSSNLDAVYKTSMTDANYQKQFKDRDEFNVTQFSNRYADKSVTDIWDEIDRLDGAKYLATGQKKKDIAQEEEWLRAYVGSMNFDTLDEYDEAIATLEKRQKYYDDTAERIKKNFMLEDGWKEGESTLQYATDKRIASAVQPYLTNSQDISSQIRGLEANKAAKELQIKEYGAVQNAIDTWGSQEAIDAWGKKGEYTELARYIPNDKDIRHTAINTNEIDDAISGLDKKGDSSLAILKYMNQDEKNTYNYLYNSDDEQHLSSENFIKDLEPTLKRRYLADKAEKIKNESSNTLYGALDASAKSIASQIGNTLALPAKVFATITDNYDPMLDKSSVYTSAYRSGAGEYFGDKLGEGGKIGYNAVMSIVDMGIAMLAGKGIATATKGASATAAATDAATAKITQAIMSSSAGSSTISDAKQNGASNGKALIMGLGSAALEWATEKYSVEAILKEPKTILGYLTKNFATEGLEEGASNIGNFILDEAISAVFSEKSELQKEVEALTLSGKYTKEEALQNAFNSRLAQLKEEVLTGSLSGLGMSSLSLGVNSAVNYAANQVELIAQGYDILEQKGVPALKELAEKLEGVADSKISKQIAKQSSKVSNVAQSVKNAKAVGRLSDMVETARISQNTADVVSALEEKGLSNKQAKKTADLIISAINTNQRDITFKDERVQEVYQELIGEGESKLKQNINERNIEYTAARLGIDVKNRTVDGTSIHKEVDTEGKVSDSGKTTQISTEQSIEIDKQKPIAKVENIDGEQKVFYNTNNGEVSAEDISYKDKDQAIIYESFTDLPTTIANSAIAAYNNDIPVEAFVKGMREGILLYGKHNFKSVGKDISVYSDLAQLSEKNQELALQLGRTLSTIETQRADEALKSAIKTATEKAEKDTTEGKKTGKKGKVSFIEGATPQNSSQKHAVTLAKVASKVIGIDIVFYDATRTTDVDLAGANGAYRDGKIYLDLQHSTNDAHTIAFTLSHELVHFVKEYSPAKFKVFADFLMDEYGKHGVSTSKLLDAKMENTKLDADAAFEEMIADACETMLLDSNVLLKLAKLKEIDLDLFEKIRLHILDILNKIRAEYKRMNYAPTSDEAKELLKMQDVIEQFYEKFEDMVVDATETFQTIGTINLNDYSSAKTTDGKTLFQYKAIKADEGAYRVMLQEHTDMTDAEINNLFKTVDKAVDIIKQNLEVLDYAWEEDIDDRAFNPVKQNSDPLYKFSVDFSTMCRKRILQQVIIEELQGALDRAVTKAESIAIRNELMKLQEQGRQIEIACALCYVESARMKSPAQIQKFLNDRGDVVRRYLATKSAGEIKEKIAKAEADTRNKLAKQYADEIAKGDMPDPTEMVGKKTKKFIALKSLPQKMADEIRVAKREVVDGYKPNANETKIIETAESLSVEDFTSAKGLENLAKYHHEIFDAYTSYIRNATKSKGTEKDVWWRIGDSQKLTDDLIATMNAENGLRTQSWSDFQVMHLLDYIGAIIELSARKAKMQAYTKVPDYVHLMGNTNQMINLSLIPTAEFNGKLDFDSVEGMAFKIALKLRDKYPSTAGTISIGINNEQIIMLLESALIDYVIPYHQSGMSKVVRKQMHIPTWESYESYQSEKSLKVEDAKKNAKAYGVELLSTKDPMWHKAPKFSEWFDAKEARQIAEMENHTPSDSASQEKYGVMYGAYKAMQNAADNYLKLCAERGLSPKFSHESADFTKEENYWKMLIDRKMINNITGKIIEQKPVQAVFDEAEVLRILNDEVARYPKVKEDQDYATRTVVSKFLSGEMNEDTAKIAASILEKPVDNITKVSILNSAEDIAPSKNLKKQAKKYSLDGNSLDKYNGIKISSKEHWRINNSLNERLHSDTKLPTYVFVSIFNPELNIDNQYCVRWRGFDDFDVIARDGTKLEEIRRIYDETYKKRQTDIPDGRDETSKYIKRRYNWDAFDAEDRRNDRRDDLLFGKQSRLNRGKSSESTNHSGARSAGEIQKQITGYIDGTDTDHLDAVNRGDMESAQKMVNLAAKKAGAFVLFNGQVKMYYHSTSSDFTSFDINKTRFGDYGYGFYISSKGTKLSKGDKVMPLFVMSNKIATTKKKTITAEKVEKFLGEVGLSKGFFGNDIEKWVSKRNDSRILFELQNKIVQFKKISAPTLLEMLQKRFGFDGLNIAGTTVIWDNNLLKSADPITYDDKGDVIPLSKRFDKSNDDIRFQKKRNVEPITTNDIAKVKSHFGITTNFDFAGYLLTDGKMLDFSGRHWGNNRPTGREVDHRDVLEAFGYEGTHNGNNGVDAMIDMIGGGNIRLMPEVGGINLAVAPNEAQRSTLLSYIRHFRGEVIVDIDEVGGDTIHTFEYNKGTAPMTVIRDIMAYFEEGVIPKQQPEYRQFLYQKKRPSNRELLSNALKSTIDDSTIEGKLQSNVIERYKESVAKIEELEKHLAEVKTEIYELSFKKGKKDTARLKELNDDKIKTSNRINVYDKRLLNIESTKPFKDILAREKDKVRKAEIQKGREALQKLKEKDAETLREVMARNQEARRKNVEGRNKTKMRNAIKNVVSDLYKKLKAGRNSVNVKEDLRGVVENALVAAELIFSDTISNEAIVRNGVSSATEAESRMLNRYADLLAKRDEIKSKIETTDKSLSGKSTDDLEKQLRSISRQINNLDKSLASVFERERRRLNGTQIRDTINNLAEAYSALQTSTDSYISGAYNEYVYERIKVLAKDIGDTTIKDMSLIQLQEVYDAYKMVQHTVVTANKLFESGKAVDEIAEQIADEIKVYDKGKSRNASIEKTFGNWMWQELKPRTAFERIGSDSLLKLYDNLRSGEDIFGRDIYEAALLAESLRKEYDFNKWDKETATRFKLENGKTFEINLEQMMSIYAYSKREQALQHMLDGGFVFDTKESFRETLTEDGKKRKIKGIALVPRAETYSLTASDLSNILKTFTKKYANAKAYVDEMQKYLTDMGEKGNEVSRAVFGINLFKEKVYFPLKSATDYLRDKNSTVDGKYIAPKLINSGMTKETTPQARNPIVLSSFDNVWADHVNKMSLYHAFVPALEDFRKVYNFTNSKEDADDISVQATIRGAFGDNAINYINKFIDDINGGMPSNEASSPTSAMFSKFKKTAVGMSLSTVIQQPTAIIRAMSVIDGKYFVGLKKERTTKQKWEEIKQYAPVAVLKEVGGFDTGSGRGISEYLSGDVGKTKLQKAGKKIDDVSMWGAGKADELGWGLIWDAVKRETQKTTDLEYGSKEFLEHCGKRFTEVITQTQVYDSTFSRSGFMRNKDSLSKFATSFMAEPTTVVNMLYESALNLSRGKISKGQAAKTMSTVITSQLAASLFASLIYALRDDEEDESFLEKYAESVGSRLRDDINVFNMLPYLRDTMSVIDGWGVERPDMTAIAEAVNATKKLWKEIEKQTDGEGALETLKDAWINFGGTALNMFGIPAKNAYRDLIAIWNAGILALDDITPNYDNVSEAFYDGLASKETTLKDRAWNAYKDGDTTRLKETVDGLVDGKYKDLDKADYKTEADMKKAAKSRVRSSFTDTYKKEYLKAYRKKDTTAMNDIRRFLYHTGLYGTLTELDKSLKEWRED